jgi:hypothetical protein
MVGLDGPIPPTFPLVWALRMVKTKVSLRAIHKIHAAANGISMSLGTRSFGPNAPMLRAPSHEGLRDPAILCAHSLSQTTTVLTTLFTSAECLIEMNLFAELVSRIEKTFDRLAEQNL